jgi:butyrate kinase
MYSVIAIDIGSTTTRIGYYHTRPPVLRDVFYHTRQTSVSMDEQLELRKRSIWEFISAQGIDPAGIDMYVSRGGLGKPGPSGIYRINEAMKEDLLSGAYGLHVSAVGPVIAHAIAQSYGKEAIVVDPPSSDEFHEEARISGNPQITRRSAFHALNHKAAARKASREMGRSYGEVNMVVVHMGGGITIGAHRKGQVIDATHGLYEGPFTPERAGSLPTMALLDHMQKQGYSRDQVQRQLIGEGGLFAYLGTRDVPEIEEKIRQADVYAEKIYRAMAYQVAKEIGAMAVVLTGKVDAIVLTGGLASSEMLVGWIREMVGFIADILVYPGEDEISALIEGGLRVLESREAVLLYPPESRDAKNK